MKKYEGLFILDIAGKEEGIKETIDKITEEITAAGGKVDTVQKMDKRSFSRVADKAHTSGFYVNIIFDGESDTIKKLQHKFDMNEDVFRVLYTEANTAAPAAA